MPIGEKDHLGIGVAQKQSPNLDYTAPDLNDEFVSASHFSVSDTVIKAGLS